jgi:S1-C subfamily serine protease
VPAQLAGRDPATDIAVLRFAHEGSAMPPLAAPGDAQVGDMVLAVGRGNEGPIAALGMVSVAGPAWRSRRGGSIDALIRLDLHLDPRAEGGVVLDAAGRFVGMAVLGPRQRPLVIPAATIERVAPRLLAEGRIARGYLGVGGYPIRLDEALAGLHALPGRRAVMVVSLAPDGPARKAGVLLGDVIVSLDGESVPGVRALSRRLGPETVGQPAELKLLRAGQMTTVRVTIAASPAP